MADARPTPLTPLVRRALGALLFLLALSGFAQMPIMKRYYIADIPGLGWLADFFATSLLHYAAAAAFLFLCGLLAARRLAASRLYSLPPMARFRLGLYLLVIVSGLAHAVNNTTSWAFSPALAQTVVLAHLAGVMALGLTWLAQKAAKVRGQR